MKNVGVFLISFILCIFLLVSEMLYMVLFNFSHGITRDEIINIIDKADIMDEFSDMDLYNELGNEIGFDVLDELIAVTEVESYVKGNAKALYMNGIYGDNISYQDSIVLKEEISNKISGFIESNQITEEQRDRILSLLDEVIGSLDEQIEIVDSDNLFFEVIRILINKKTANYVLVGVFVISAIILVVNKSKNGYLFIGLPTLITGVLFLILLLAIQGRIPETSIDIDIKNFIVMYLPELLNSLKKSSYLMAIFGLIGCGLYTVLNLQEGSNYDEQM